MVDDTLEKESIKSKKKKSKEKNREENKKQNNKESNKQKSKKLPKEISQEILKQMFRNLLRAVGIMLYFLVLNLAHSKMAQERLVGDIEVFSGVFLIVGIFFLEKAYRKDQGGTAITGVEFLFLSLHSLSIMHVITMFKYDFRSYLLTSSYIFAIYYVLKAIVLYTKGRREYLKSLSDISEIVKKEEPVKKEAKKSKNKLNEEEVKAKTAKTRTKKVEEKLKESKTEKEKTTKVKMEKVKEEQTETKIPEKKKRGRPKKEVTKND